MKLPDEVKNPNLWLEEFDHWITPSLDEIQDSEKFKVTLGYVIKTFDLLAELTSDFTDESQSFDELVGAYLERAFAFNASKRFRALDSLIITLLLTTAKTNNNIKCQFPVYLRDSLKWCYYPQVHSRKSKKSIVKARIPRTLDLKSIIKRVIQLDEFPNEQRALVTAYTKFLIGEEKELRALFQIGRSYIQAKNEGSTYPGAILEPLVTYQVRGSVSASGGHVPEQLLRLMMNQWGLVQDKDYNTNDVLIEPDGDFREQVSFQPTEEELLTEDEPAKKTKEKTRAFDFILPYKVDEWKQRLFIQSQFYAGDSGSVSHKNLDQVFASRTRTKKFVAHPLFVEYVDGAGYYSALNGDLKKLLNKDDTHSFFQVRSAPVRLRQLLQSIGFLCPLEIEHAIAQTDGTKGAVEENLLNDGYSADEVERVIRKAFDLDFITVDEGSYKLRPEREEVVRHYAILDTVARQGSPLTDINSASYILTPGYGPFYGIKLTDLVEALGRDAPYFYDYFQKSQHLNRDLEALKVKGWIKLV